jgi:4-hydroxybenzoate polyprenyltransferase
LGDKGVWPGLNALNFLNLIGKIGFIIALSASSATIVFSLIFIGNFDMKLIIIVFTITMGCYSLDRLLDVRSNVGKKRENKSLKKLESFMKPFIFIILIIGLILAFQHSLIFGSLILLAPVSILTYSYNFGNTLVPIKTIPYSKDIIIALGWTVLIFVVILYYDLPISSSIILFSLAMFGKFYVMAALYDFKDIQDDSKRGIATLPNTLGERKTKMILHTINSIATITILILVYLHILPILCFIFFAAWLYQECLIFGVGLRAPLWFYYLPCDLEQVFWLLFAVLWVIGWT